MFKNRNTRRQMIFVGMSLFMVMIVGQLSARLTRQVFEFTNAMPEYVSFTAEYRDGKVRATITNTGERDLLLGGEYIIVRLAGDSWRVVSVAEYEYAAEINLPPGASFTITEEMRDAQGTFRIVARVSKGDVVSQAWAEFTLQPPG